jgi:hypothetical protein
VQTGNFEQAVGHLYGLSRELGIIDARGEFYATLYRLYHPDTTPVSTRELLLRQQETELLQHDARLYALRTTKLLGQVGFSMLAVQNLAGQIAAVMGQKQNGQLQNQYLTLLNQTEAAQAIRANAMLQHETLAAMSDAMIAESVYRINCALLRQHPGAETLARCLP